MFTKLLFIIPLIGFTISFKSIAQVSRYSKPPTFVDNSDADFETLRRHDSNLKRMNKNLENEKKVLNNEYKEIFNEGLLIALEKEENGCSNQVNKYRAFVQDAKNKYIVKDLFVEMKIYNYKMSKMSCK